MEQLQSAWNDHLPWLLIDFWLGHLWLASFFFCPFYCHVVQQIHSYYRCILMCFVLQRCAAIRSLTFTLMVLFHFSLCIQSAVMFSVAIELIKFQIGCNLCNGKWQTIKRKFIFLLPMSTLSLFAFDKYTTHCVCESLIKWYKSFLYVTYYEIRFHWNTN